MAAQAKKPKPMKPWWQQAGAVASLGAGALLLSLVTAYYVYGLVQERNIGDFNYSIERPEQQQQGARGMLEERDSVNIDKNTDQKEQDSHHNLLAQLDTYEKGLITATSGLHTIPIDSHLVTEPRNDQKDPVEQVDVNGHTANRTASRETYKPPAAETESIKKAPGSTDKLENPLSLNSTPVGEESQTNNATSLKYVPYPTSQPKRDQEGGEDGNNNLDAAFQGTPAGKLASKEEDNSEPKKTTVLTKPTTPSPSPVDKTIPSFSPSLVSPSYPPEMFTTQASTLPVPVQANLQVNPSPATQVSIPSIQLESEVVALRVIPSNNGFEWETPKDVVGHIPTTAMPGEKGQGWYFGHLESPIRGEGNVFKDLPKIPGLLRKGETVDIFLAVADRVFKYQVYKTDWLNEEDLSITNSGQHDITLVTCFPRFHYDKRLLVTAALIDIAKL